MLSISLQSFIMVLISEMGDKTQLIALILASRFRAPWTIMAGICVATILNHALATYIGGWLASIVDPSMLKWILAITFWAFAFWILIPDKEEEENKLYQKWGPFLTTTVVFFLAEMGDKTQLATAALGARFSAPITVTIGTTIGMLVADGLAVFLGHKFIHKINLSLIRKIAFVLFILFGVAVLL